MICIVLQYHAGDYYRAMELARFIAQLERRPRTDVKFAFFGRWDARDPDVTTLDLVGKKFGVRCARTSRHKWTGWPSGPNGIAKEALETAPSWLWREFGIVTQDGPLLMLEPDCVPFARDWLDQMIDDWQTFGTGPDQRDGVWQIGAWRDSGGADGHINGNCLIRSDIAHVLPLQVITPHLAWDCAIAPLMAKHWYHSWLFRNDFQSTHASLATLTTPIRGDRPPVLIHGYKDNSALKLARQHLL